MKRNKLIAAVLLTFAILFGAGSVMAQKDSTRLKQEVEVTKAYQPTILDAVKINDIPKVKPEQSETPTFDYSIYSKPVFATFDVTPITAAKMVGDPKSEMELGLLKLGFGNYLSPYGELFFNSKPDRNSNFGLHFKHLSSYGKVKLLNDDKVKAPQSESSAEIFGKKFFRKATLSASLAYDRKSFNYYGYTGGMLSDNLKEEMIPYFQDKQFFSKGTGAVELKSETKSVYDLSYDFAFKAHYLVTKTGQSENVSNLSADLNKKFDNTLGLLHISIEHDFADSIWNNITNEYGRKQQLYLKINPSVKWVADNASLQVGLNTTMYSDDDTNSSLRVYPKVKAEWSPVERILTLFAGVDGYLKQNSYSSISTENPYVDPYHDVMNANYKYILSGGFKGKLSSRTNYVAGASYSKVKDQHFYVTESQNFFYPEASFRRLDNTFSWVYDDVNILKISGEVLHSVSDNFSIHLFGNYYSYDLKTQIEAWQMPDFDFTFSGIYKATEQLKFTTDIFVVGSRTALLMEPVSSSVPSGQVKMDPIFDLNVGGEYQFSEKLNFFVKLNNFGFQKYEQWLGYTNKGFNWMAGMSYSF